MSFLQDESHETSKERAPSASPFLMVSPGHQVLLMENNKDEFLEVLDDDGLARAVICLVGIYYVFHLDYPGPAKGVFLLLQEHIFHYFLSKRPLKYAARLAELELPRVQKICLYQELAATAVHGYFLKDSSFFDVNMSVVFKEFEKR